MIVIYVVGCKSESCQTVGMCTGDELSGMSSSEPVVKLLLGMMEVLCCGLYLMEVLQPFFVCE